MRVVLFKMNLQEKEAKTKKKRASFEQLEIYIDYISNNPDFLAAKNTSKNPKFDEETWAELSNKLNSQKGATKTAKEWKQSLGHWKNQLKSRARKNKVEILLTGDGVPSLTKLTEFEERALRCFGEVTVSGNENIPTTDFEETASSNDNINENIVTAIIEDTRLTDNEVNTHEYDFGASTSQRITLRKRNSTTIVEVSKKILKLADQMRAANINAEKRLKIDELNAQSMAKMADAMHIMATMLSNQNK